MRLAVGLLIATGAWAQAWEASAVIGYGFYRNGTIYSPAGTAEAGIRNRFAAGLNVGYEFSDYVAGEFSYLYHDGHPFLRARGTRTDIQGQNYALTLHGQFFFKPPSHCWRPFLSGGLGAKDYVIAGPEPFPQPAPDIATLTDNDVWKTVFSVGGGIKYRPRAHVSLRAEFRDYLTTFPRQQIVPAPHNTARGVFQQLTLLFGVGYTF